MFESMDNISYFHRNNLEKCNIFWMKIVKAHKNPERLIGEMKNTQSASVAYTLLSDASVNAVILVIGVHSSKIRHLKH